MSLARTNQAKSFDSKPIAPADVSDTASNPRTRPKLGSFLGGRFWQFMWPPLAYLLLTLLMTWPLALNLGNGTIHFIASDHYQNLWNIWWFRTSLFEQHHSPFYTDVLFYPYRSDQHPLELYFHTLQPILMLLLAPLSYLLGIVGSYNLMVLASFVVSGWGMYLLARYFTQNVWSAFVAGVLFDFCAYHLNILAVGQTNLMLIGTIPLYILFLHKSIAPLRPETKVRRAWFYPALAILTLTIAAYIDWYYPLYLLLYTVGLVMIVLVRRSVRWRSTLIRFVAIMGCWLVLVSPLLFLVLQSTNDKDINYKPTFDFEVIHSTALFSFFQPFKDLRIKPGAWQQPFLGYTTLLLAVVGIWFCWKRRGWAAWWVGLVIVFGVLSLGPYLRLNLTDDASKAISSGLPLPYLWLQNIPPISFSRSPSRFVVMMEMALAMLAAFGVSGLLEKIGTLSKRVKFGHVFLPAALTLAVTTIVCLEMQTLPWPIEKMEQPQIFKQIAAESGDFAIMELPLTNHGVQDARRMYYQTIHHRPIAGGYIARQLTDYFRGDATPFDDYFDSTNHEAFPILDVNNENNAAVRLLNLYNFRYLAIYKDEYWSDDLGTFYNGPNDQVDARWQGNYEYVQQLLGPAAQVYQDSNITVFRVPQIPPTTKPLIYNLANWYRMERLANSTPYQWAKADPILEGANGQTQKVHLELTAWAFQPGSQFDVQVNGQIIGQLTLSDQPAEYSTPEFTLPKGEFKLVLHNLTPPLSPQSRDPKSNDARELTLAASHVELVPSR